ncbi:RNA chaperone ProQ (plasmid) [Sinorhizobium americanum CCGM7]|uniref:ProQ/FINO family protein n=1 Tax=Sinorhizobium americanum TaxID=194963 RepID=UPI0004DAD08D|nr:ProQ/FinO family protein [Sinorhizobium americanum]APG86402.1 RNA chaperone ProQ [Sinorhizobium americanum CCGM7]
MPTEQKRKSPSALFRYLSERWPGTFDAKEPKPLKIGIRGDIRALDSELSDEDLNRALRAYTRRDKYLAQLRTGVTRVDLNGDAAGEVTEADAATAKAWLQARFGMADTTQLPQPEELAALAKPNPMLDSKAKLSPSKPQGFIVETKRRRLPSRRFGP